MRDSKQFEPAPSNHTGAHHRGIPFVCMIITSAHGNQHLRCPPNVCRALPRSGHDFDGWVLKTKGFSFWRFLGRAQKHAGWRCEANFWRFHAILCFRVPGSPHSGISVPQHFCPSRNFWLDAKPFGVRPGSVESFIFTFRAVSAHVQGWQLFSVFRHFRHLAWPAWCTPSDDEVTLRRFQTFLKW